ncbi:hypothetical protein [Actinokineospora sp. NPDC004072]
MSETQEGGEGFGDVEPVGAETDPDLVGGGVEVVGAECGDLVDRLAVEDDQADLRRS